MLLKLLMLIVKIQSVQHIHKRIITKFHFFQLQICMSLNEIYLSINRFIYELSTYRAVNTFQFGNIKPICLSCIR
jgi:hypothetical protein